MGSGIFFARQYLEEPTFEHYFPPRFAKSGMEVGGRHFFRNNDDSVLFSLSGDVSRDSVYEVFRNTISDISKELKENEDKWNTNPSQTPKWVTDFPTLIDKEPRIIGIYEGDADASKIFSITLIDYATETVGEKVSDFIKETLENLGGLGEKLSGLR